jgi:SAM-dependent methyltransferase
MDNAGFEPDPTLVKLYPEAAVGGFSQVDGVIEFYTRVNALVDADSRVLDFGAGRAWWTDEPVPPMSHRLRLLRGRVKEVVGTDVDPAVLSNPSLDAAHVVGIGEPLPLDDGSFDLVVADYVLEHVNPDDARRVAADIIRVLKPGGWFAARTPNKWGYIGLGARLVPNRLHVGFLKILQPGRVAEDVFPVRYAMNTKRDLRRLFAGHDIHVYGHKSEPAYFGRSVIAWRLAAFLGWLTPRAFAPTWMVFVRKSES